MRFLTYLSLLIVAPCANAFEVNVSDGDVSRFLGYYLIGDLTVGDSAYVGTYDFCVVDGKLHLMKNNRIKTGSEYYSNLKIAVVPNNQVLVVPRPRIGETDFQDDDKTTPLHIVPDVTNCKLHQDWMDEELKLFEVKSIQGFTDMESYVRYLISNGWRYED